jgi:hypothetical protein
LSFLPDTVGPSRVASTSLQFWVEGRGDSTIIRQRHAKCANDKVLLFVSF